MAVVNLPDSPANGDTQDVGGITYTYSSSKGYWTAASSGGGGGGGASVTTDDSAPGSPSDGDLWYDTDDGGMFVYYEDADSSQWVEVIGSQGAAGAAGAAGADGSATVVADTTALLAISSPSAGDQVYVTANNTLYFYNGSGWYKIALINTNPTISGVSSSYALATDGTATTVTITASDPEGLPITYSIASDTSGNIAAVSQGTGANTNVFTVTPSTNTSYAGTFSLTFRASDGVNFATAPATFTLQFSVENSNYTTALITSVGTNNAVNNSFDDASTNDHTITAAGNVTQTTFSPCRHGGYSTYFDGSGDYLTIADNAAFNFGSGDSTIEMWVYPLGTGTFNLITRGTSGYSGFILSSTGFLESTNGSSWTTNITFSTAITANSWQHVAVVRNGSTITVYRNGTSIGTSSISGSVVSAAQSLTIGQRAGQSDFSGYMTDLRIVKGTAVYTSAFTPPTERLTAVTNTSLLTCHLPYIADGSTNGHSITVYGNTKTQPFAPYDAQEYTAADHGGSLSFDGSGDSLSAAASTSLGLGTGDFTVEWWVNFDTISNYPYQIDMRSADNDTPLALYTNTGSGNVLGVYVSAAVIATGTNAFKPGIWTHYAVCKTGGYLKGYFNGKEDFSITCTRDYGTSEAIRIGAVYGNNNYYVDGNISDVRIVKGTAVYTSAFTPPTTPLTAITNTSLLLNGTDAGIIDKSQSVQTLTLNGDVKSSTTQTKYLSSSMYFDGSGDRIQLPQTSLNLSNADFTVEAWVYTTATSQQTIVGSLAFSNGTGSWLLTVNYNSNKVRFFMRHGGGTVQDAQFEAGTFPTNAWTHVAVTRDGSNLRAFINGTQAGTTNTALGTNAIDNALTNYYIGDNQDGNTYWNGYISDVRITKGLARYTANFTAPTAALKG